METGGRVVPVVAGTVVVAEGGVVVVAFPVVFPALADGVELPQAAAATERAAVAVRAEIRVQRMVCPLCPFLFVFSVDGAIGRPTKLPGGTAELVAVVRQGEGRKRV
jgi:hypothetical protein